MIPFGTTAGALVLLAGCASFSADGGFDSVGQLTQERVGQTPVCQRTESQGDTVQARTAELLGQPLTADDAVELAMLNNRGLQASFQELGVAESTVMSGWFCGCCAWIGNVTNAPPRTKYKAIISAGDFFIF